MPDKMSKEKIDLLRAYGAEVVVAPTDVSPDSPQSYYRVADRLTEEIPGAFQPNQYANMANPETHYVSTGPELWRQSRRADHALRLRRRHRRHDHRRRPLLRERNPDIEVIGADPVGSIFSNDEVHPYLVEGVGEDFSPRPTTHRGQPLRDGLGPGQLPHHRRLAAEEGLLVGGSCGLAVHAALQVGKRDRRSGGDGGHDPARRRARLPLEDLQRRLDEPVRLPGAPGDRTVGDVLFAKTAAGEIPPFVTVQTHQKVKDAISLLHEHRVSQLPVVSGTDVNTMVGSVGERGLLKRAMDDPGLMGIDIVDVMEPPFPAVSTTDPVREAVELLAGEGQALTVTEGGRPVGIVTRADLLESLVS